jgi:hypothetical protein
MIIPCAFGPLRLGVKKLRFRMHEKEISKRFNAKAPGRKGAKMRHRDLNAFALPLGDTSAFHPVHPVNPVSASAFPAFLLHCSGQGRAIRRLLSETVQRHPLRGGRGMDWPKKISLGDV